MSRPPRGIKIETSERIVRGWDAAAGVYVLPEAEHTAFVGATVADETPLSPKAAAAIHEYLRLNRNQGSARKLAQELAQKKLDLRPRRIVEPLISKELGRKEHRPKSRK